MVGNTGLKFIALAVLFEFIFIKPYIIPNSDRDGTDFIGFGLVHAVLAYFGKINIKDLDPKRMRSALLNGLLGGLFSYAWLLLHVTYRQRRTHHIFAANFVILLGILFGAWAERRKKAGGLSVSGGFLINNNDPKMRLERRGVKPRGCCGEDRAWRPIGGF
ncbi:hypothetical protein M409DRAFT_20359 [Zasmidium cellare ATCC 36951]|uniref:Uncharacterized protein n=1 Tax=Zasmidium cellare ATCC 36951 TaxID=1080233 RepID=A0A6A6CTH5_ZASCE|nr:uncharacterized protein M409DRAFT_20359 [Zasmidium cellare ATCC 36951]KAF2169132.1 hypothetical protein M409DRAFT_20359 [Zasmidium cellare ATCC 36951]